VHRKLAPTAVAIVVVVAFIVVSVGMPGPASASSTPSCPKPPAVDPTNFSGHEIDNTYFPLPPGTTFHYEGKSGGDPSTDDVFVTHQTKTIIGVETTVVRDTLHVNGRLVEQTDDWYAQDDDGTVWYFGEDTKEFNRRGEVISTEGSWEAGRHRAKAGIFMPADPKVNQVFHQELAKGVAEDCFQIVSLHESVTVPYTSSDQAMKTKEFTRLEPDIDHKWYVPDVGVVRDEGPDDHLELVSVTHA
jgi:hypothetical protein